MNDSLIKGHWRELKGEVQKAWGEITDDELETTKGNFNAIVGLLQQKYGMEKDALKGKLSEIVSRFKDGVEDFVQPSRKSDELDIPAAKN